MNLHYIKIVSNIQSMIERVRLHPQLITGNKDQETSLQRYTLNRKHDISMKIE